MLSKHAKALAICVLCAGLFLRLTENVHLKEERDPQSRNGMGETDQ